jgi:hypothetical protein
MNESLKSTPTLDDLRAQRDAILKLAEKHRAYNVRVFGSVARGEATPDSDVDFLVSVKPKTSIFELVGLWLDLQDLLGREVNLSTDEGLRDYMKSNVLRDAVSLGHTQVQQATYAICCKS